MLSNLNVNFVELVFEWLGRKKYVYERIDKYLLQKSIFSL